MVLDKELVEVLDTARRGLENMSTSDRLAIWQDLHNTKLDTSNLNFNPSSVPTKPFNPEDLNSIFDIDIPYNKGSNKVEPLNITPKDKEPFRAAQAVSLQDIKDLGNNIYEGVKLVDITGTLSWSDYSKAQEEFEKNPNIQTSANLLLCSLAVIPALGVATSPTKPLKSVLSSTLTKSLKDLPQDISKLSQAEREIKLGPLVKKASNLLKSKEPLPTEINTGVLNRALIILDNKRNKVNPSVPANVFKDMVREFKANGGQFIRRDGYITLFKPSENVIRLSPRDYKDHRGGFRTVIAHEMGHSFTTPRTTRLDDLPSSTPTFRLNNLPGKNPYDKPYDRKKFVQYINGTIYDELNAELEVLKRMKLGGASKTQLSDYAQDGIKSIQTYKRMLIVENPGAYSDYMAVKHVLLDNPSLSKSTSNTLSKDPEVISDFDRLLKELSQKSKSPKLTEDKILNLKSELQAQKSLSYETHKRAFNEIEEKLTFKNASGITEARYPDNTLNTIAIETYMEKNVPYFKDFKKMVSDNTESLKVRELESYVIKPNKKVNKSKSLQEETLELMMP
jgi:hypothetical protein